LGLAEIHLFPRSPYIRMRSFICLFKSLLSKGQNKNCAQLSGHGKGLHNAGQIESRIMYIRVIVSSWITSLTCGQLTSQSHTCVQNIKCWVTRWTRMLLKRQWWQNGTCNRLGAQNHRQRNNRHCPCKIWRILALSCSIIHQTYQSIASCSEVLVIATDVGTSWQRPSKKCLLLAVGSAGIIKGAKN
jgi:hypothetical protein